MNNTKNTMGATDSDVDKITELVRDVEIAKAAYEGKKLELLLFIRQLKDPDTLRMAQRKATNEAMRVLSQPKLRVKIKTTTRGKYVPPEKRIDTLVEFLRKNRWSATSAVMKSIGTDYAKTLYILEELEKKGRVKRKTGKSFKHSGRMIAQKLWALP